MSVTTLSKVGPTLEELLRGCTAKNRYAEQFKEPIGQELI